MLVSAFRSLYLHLQFLMRWAWALNSPPRVCNCPRGGCEAPHRHSGPEITWSTYPHLLKQMKPPRKSLLSASSVWPTLPLLSPLNHTDFPRWSLKPCSFTFSASSVNVPRAFRFHSNLGNPGNTRFSTALGNGGCSFYYTPCIWESLVNSLYSI